MIKIAVAGVILLGSVGFIVFYMVSQSGSSAPPAIDPETNQELVLPPNP
jgi:flagellar basal body-associated protein FliL